MRDDGDGKKKHLVNDHCMSEDIFARSLWSSCNVSQTDHNDELQRLTHDEIPGDGSLKFVLEWDGKSKLDLHAKCACGNWTVSKNDFPCASCLMRREEEESKSGPNRQTIVFPKEAAARLIGH